MHGQAEAILVAYDIMEVDGRDVRRRGFRRSPSARQNECGRRRSPTLPSRITTFAPSLHGGAFLVWLSRAPAWRATE